jgi:MFS_1 like family
VRPTRQEEARQSDSLQAKQGRPSRGPCSTVVVKDYRALSWTADKQDLKSCHSAGYDCKQVMSALGEKYVGYVSLKFLSFAMYTSMGVLHPYLPVFFESVGMDKSQIGVLTMVPSIFSFVFAPVWSWLSDKFDSLSEVIVLLLIVSSVLRLFTMCITDFMPMLILVSLTAMFNAPLPPLTDAFTLDILHDESTYGSVRLYGAISFGIFSFLGGYLISDITTTTADPIRTYEESIDSAYFADPKTLFRPLFYTSVLALTTTGFIVLFTEAELLIKALNKRPSFSVYNAIAANEPAYAPNHTQSGLNNMSDDVSERSDEARQSIFSSIARLYTTEPLVVIFSVVVFLSGIGAGVIDGFLFLYLKDLGGAGMVMGTSRFVTCFAEIPMFELAGYMQRSFGAVIIDNVHYVFMYCCAVICHVLPRSHVLLSCMSHQHK